MKKYSKNKEIVYNDIVFTYGLSKPSQSKAAYGCVLSVHIIDPITGKRMKKPVREKCIFDENSREEKEVEIVKCHYFGKNEELTDKKVLDAANKCARDLYAEHNYSIEKKMRALPEIGKINSSQMYHRYIKDFMRTKGRTKKSTQKENERIIRNACKELMDDPVNSISNKKLDTLFSNNTYLAKKNMICEFFDYCKAQGAYSEVNPIANYLDRTNIKREKKAKYRYPKELSHLPLDIELSFHALMLEHLGDKEIMAPILAKCAKLSLAKAIALRWESVIIIDNDYVAIIDENNNTGSFHVMDRLVLMEGASLIIEKRRKLIEEYGSEEAIKSKKVIPIRISKSGRIDSDTKLKSHLTTYIRNMLIQAGLQPEEINSAAPGTRKAGGSGVALLRKHYDYVIQERCGIDIESPEGKYIRGLKPGDVTNTYYRSLNDKVSGILFFEGVVRRDDFFLPRMKGAIEADIKKEGNYTNVVVSSPGPGQRLSIVLPRTLVTEGTHIVISSRYGITGEIRFQNFMSNDDIIPQNI